MHARSLRHRVEVEIERPAVAHVKNAWLGMALERVRRVARQADVSRAIDLGLRAVSSDIGKGPRSQT